MLIATCIIVCYFCWLFAIKLTVNSVNAETKQQFEFWVKSFFFWLAVIVSFLTGLSL